MRTNCLSCSKTFSMITDLHLRKFIPAVCSEECLHWLLKCFEGKEIDTSKFKMLSRVPNNRLRSSFEVRFKTFLDKYKYTYEYEPFAIAINKKLYIPDFFLPDKNLLVELKGRWTGKYSSVFEKICALYPENILLINNETFKRVFK